MSKPKQSERAAWVRRIRALLCSARDHEALARAIRRAARCTQAMLDAADAAGKEMTRCPMQ